MHESLFQAHELLIEGLLHVHYLFVLLVILVCLELFVPVMTLHVLDSLMGALSRQAKITSGRSVQLTIHACSSKLYGLHITFIILLHDHLLVVCSECLVIHYNPLLDSLFEWRVSKMADDASVHWAMAYSIVIIGLEILSQLVECDYVIVRSDDLRPFTTGRVEGPFKPQFIFLWWSHGIMELHSSHRIVP